MFKKIAFYLLCFIIGFMSNNISIKGEEEPVDNVVIEQDDGGGASSFAVDEDYIAFSVYLPEVTVTGHMPRVEEVQIIESERNDEALVMLDIPIAYLDVVPTQTKDIGDLIKTC